MKLTVVHQESYSRTELILRTLFGAFYIVLPHAFILFFLSIWGGILAFVASPPGLLQPFLENSTEKTSIIMRK